MVKRLPRGGDLTPTDLAKRLHLLLDFVEVERGTPLTFSEIASYAADVGVTVSRAKWQYMLSGGGHRNKNEWLLNALATLFDVDKAYLFEYVDMPPKVESQLENIRALRTNRVVAFASRTFQGALTPGDLGEITRSLHKVPLVSLFD